MPGKAFSPARSTIVAGDVVVLTNTDCSSPTTCGWPAARSTPADHVLQSWSKQFDRPGGYPYVCTLHVGMSGNLDVPRATLGATAARCSRRAGDALRAGAGRHRAGRRRAVRRRRAWTAVGAGAAPAPMELRDDRARGHGGRVIASHDAGGASLPVTPRVQAALDVRVRVKRKRTTMGAGGTTVPRARGSSQAGALPRAGGYRWRPQRARGWTPKAAPAPACPPRCRTYARVTLSPRWSRAPPQRRLLVADRARGRRPATAIVPHGGGGHGVHG